jgi:hypothetical protein
VAIEVFAQWAFTDGTHDGLLCGIMNVLSLFLGARFDLGRHGLRSSPERNYSGTRLNSPIP